jgi:outer membrane lipoprotein-sorting protein
VVLHRLQLLRNGDIIIILVMKHLILFMAVAAVVISSCKKENQEGTLQSIVGRWELRQLFGAQIPNAQTVFSKGNGRFIEFAETEYRYIESGKVTYTETYQLATESKEIDGNSYSQVFLAGKNNFKNYFKITGNKLMISNGTQAADGTTVIYERL